MFPRESFHYFLNAPKTQFNEEFIVSQDETYSLNLFHLLKKDQSDGIFHLLSNGVTSIISLQMREKSTDEVRTALESLANQGSGNQNNETCFSVFQAHQLDDQFIFPYAINAFSVYWKPTAKLLMLNFSIQHLMALTNNVPIIADLQTDTYNEEPDRCNIIDRVKCPLLITSNGDTSIASGVSEFKPLMRVWDLSESEPDFYLTVCDSARISHNFLFVYLKTDSEKVFTLLTCEPGNFQGLMSAICQNFTIDANNIQDILIMDREGNISIVQDWAYVHNRAFTIAVHIIDNVYFVLLKE